uniref:Uncharacterized protein n=1 Tax=Glossina pallidipes TaxID=7398 RepID=A0A1B0A9J0_GLOPL
MGVCTEERPVMHWSLSFVVECGTDNNNFEVVSKFGDNDCIIYCSFLKEWHRQKIDECMSVDCGLQGNYGHRDDTRSIFSKKFKLFLVPKLDAIVISKKTHFVEWILANNAPKPFFIKEMFPIPKLIRFQQSARFLGPGAREKSPTPPVAHQGSTHCGSAAGVNNNQFLFRACSTCPDICEHSTKSFSAAAAAYSVAFRSYETAEQATYDESSIKYAISRTRTECSDFLHHTGDAYDINCVSDRN